jgi:hypothetical protein
MFSFSYCDLSFCVPTPKESPLQLTHEFEREPTADMSGVQVQLIVKMPPSLECIVKPSTM